MSLKRSLVLLSSGLDSTVNLYAARRFSDVVLALTFDYGQRAAQQEIRHSKKLCEILGVEHQVIQLPWLGAITRTSLVNTDAAVPTNMQIDNLSEIHDTAKRVWVPNRNGVFLNIAAAFADSLNIAEVIPGFNAEEAVTFPDNSQEYMEVTSNAFRYSTQNSTRVHCYTAQMNKTEIVRFGQELGVNFDLVWTCYMAGETPCGRCESCLRFERAKRDAFKI